MCGRVGSGHLCGCNENLDCISRSLDDLWATVLLISAHSQHDSLDRSIVYFSLIQARKVFVFYKSMMSNATLFIVGSIRQGHEQFSDISRGRQCCFMSFQRCWLLCVSRIQFHNGVLLQPSFRCFWKTQYPRYRDAVADLSTWSSLLVFVKPIRPMPLAWKQLLNQIIRSILVYFFIFYKCAMRLRHLSWYLASNIVYNIHQTQFSISLNPYLY